MKTSEILKAGKALIEKPENWMKSTMARNSNGEPVYSANCETAVSWCSAGALRKASPYDTCTQEYKKAVSKLQYACEGGIITFNDTYNHSEIMEAWDKAIQLAEAEND
jgi:hypothetical protein